MYIYIVDTTILKDIECGVYEEYAMALSKIMFSVLQDATTYI